MCVWAVMAFHLALQRALRFAKEEEGRSGGGSGSSGLGFGFGKGGEQKRSGDHRPAGAMGSGLAGGATNERGVGHERGSTGAGVSGVNGTGSNGSNVHIFRPSGNGHRRNPSRDLASVSAKQLGLEKSMSVGSLPLSTSKSLNGLSSMAEHSSECHGHTINIGLVVMGDGCQKAHGGGGAGAGMGAKKGHGGGGGRYNGGKDHRDNASSMLGQFKDCRMSKWCAIVFVVWVVVWVLMGGVRALGRTGLSGGATVVSADFFSSKDLARNDIELLNAAERYRNGTTTANGNPRQRIVLVTAAYNHIVDGVSMTLNRLVHWLLRQGHEVVIVAPTSSQPMIEHAGELLAVPSIAVPGRQEYRLSISLPSAVRSQMTEFNPTLVHIATPDVVGHSAQDWGRRHNVPVVCSYHTRFNSYLPYYYLGWLDGVYWYLFRKFSSKCEQMYVPSETVRQELVGHDVDPSSIRTWSRGVDTSVFSPEFRSETWRREVARVVDETPILVLVSRIVWEKGLDVFMHVVKELERRNLRFKSVVVGDGPAREAMERQMPNTLFLGKQTGDDLAAAYASSDIYVFPSHTETFGATSLEAMSSGLPVIVAGGPSDSMVNNGTSGFIVSPYSCDRCFVDFAETLIQNATLRKEMGARSRAIAVENFQWDAVFSELVTHYNEATNASSASPDPRHEEEDANR